MKKRKELGVLKRFTTYTQHRILKDYWQNHIPFTVSSLMERRILHFPALGRLTLRLMECRGQIMEQCKWNGEPLYIATTETKEEWADIWRYKRQYSETCCAQYKIVLGMNRFERQKYYEELDETLMESQRQIAFSES